MNVSWVSFKGTHPRGTRHDGSVQQVVDFVTSLRTSYVKENVDGFSPTIYFDHYVAVTPQGTFDVDAPSAWRCATAVQAITALVLDLDHHAPDWAALRRDGTFLVLYTTWRHAADDPRWRLIAPLASPIAIEAQAALWRTGVDRFAPHADPSCKDASRFYFVHSAHPRRAHLAQVRILEGELWAPEGLDGGDGGDGGDKPVSVARPGVHHPLPIGLRAREFIEDGAAVGTQRWRALSAARNLLSAGSSVEDTIALVWQGLERSPQEERRVPWTEADAERLVLDLSMREPTPVAPLEGPTVRLRRVVEAPAATLPEAVEVP